MKTLLVCTLPALIPLAQSAARAAAQEPLASSASAASAGLAQLSGTFVENRGQWDSPARFAAWKGVSSASLEPTAIRLRLGEERTALALCFEGASPDATLVGAGQRAGEYNFFLGKEPERWHSQVPAFARVLYRGLYPGIDLCVREEGRRLEYDLLLAPGADLARFVVRVEGASSLALSTDGELVLESAAGAITQTPPRTWELLPDGSQLPLESRFLRIDGQHYGFEVPSHDAERALVVDPGLDWCTYLGGDKRDVIIEVERARDGTGDLIVVGDTQSLDFPTTGGRAMSPDTFLPFVARFDATGTTLVYATLFGSPGIHGEFVNDMALDASSAPIIVGSTRSPDLPVTAGALDTTYSGGTSNTDDCYVTRFNASASQLVFSTYLGVAPVPDASTPSGFRGGAEEAWRVALDPSGAIVVAGFTISPDFPTTAGAFDRTLSGGQDLFVARLSANGAQLTYSTFLGGDGGERVSDMVVDAAGFVTLTGFTGAETGAPFPTTPDALRRDHAGGFPTHRDSYLARLALTGAGVADLRYSTIFPGQSDEENKGLAVHPTDPELVTVVGFTRSFDFPTTPGAFQRVMVSPTDWQSAFASQFRFPAAGGGGLVWSTLLGGPGFQGATGVAIESGGDVVVAGFGGMDFPTTQGSYDRLGLSQDGFLARLSSDGRVLDYATIFGGSELEDGLRVLSLAPRAVIVSGWSESTDLITTPGAFDRVFGAAGNGDAWFAYDGFLARFTLERGSGTDTTAPAPTLVSPAAGAAFPAPTDFSLTTVTFDWSDVSDPSGVQVYQIEISPDPDFFLNRLNVAEWTVKEPNVSQIDVTFSRFLGQQGPYSWRVRTLDGVNNWSPWSAARKFNLGQSPVPRISHAELATVAVTGGSVVQGTVVLQDLPAPAGGFQIFLSSSNPAVASVPATVTVPAGADRASFTVTTSTVAKSTPVLFTIRDDGLPDTPTLWVDPAAPGTIALASLALSPTSVVGGSTSTGTVTLNGAAPAGGTLVTLASNHTAAGVPPSVTVAAGLTSAVFGVTTSAVPATVSATISASAGGATRTAALSITAPPAPSTPSLLSPANGATLAQPITFDWNDAANAATYLIQIDNSSNFTTPLTFTQTVSQSQTTVSGLPAQQLFWRVRGINSAGVNGSFSSSRSFTAQAAPPVASLSAVSVNPTSVVGGNASIGTVTLTSAAATGGLLVNLSSSNTSVATVPASVTVAAGATTATFSATTSTVASSTAVTITATQGSTTRTATLTVNPVPTGPLPAPSLSSPASDARFSPGQNITFDWSDVAGAANYTLQIDDNQTISSPFVLQQTVTPSTFSTSTLPTRTMWWRVRANDSAGNPGNWSSVRRFEVKN
jgi:hypothetical protein